MAHEMFWLAKASEKELDLIVYGGAGILVIMLLLVGLLVWRDRRRLANSSRPQRPRTKRSKRR